MATTLEQATAAKAALRSRLGRPEWLRGVGLGLGPDGYFVKVNVAELTPAVRTSVPRVIGDVRVQVEAVGDIEALAKLG